MWSQGVTHPQQYMQPQQQMQQQHMQQYMQQHMGAYPGPGYEPGQHPQVHHVMLQQQHYAQQQHQQHMQQQQMQQQHTPAAYGYQQQRMYQQGYAFASPATASSYGSPAAAASGSAAAAAAAASPYGSTASQMSPYGAAFGPIHAVCPPADPELAKRIRTMAEYCARNPEMERMVRQRDGTDPRFAFLSRGEGFDYYRYVLSCIEKGIPFDGESASPHLQQQQHQQQQHQQQLQQQQLQQQQLQQQQLQQQQLQQQQLQQQQQQLQQQQLQQQQQQQQQQQEWSYDLESILILYQQRRPASKAEALSPSQERELQEVLQTLETDATTERVRAARRWAEVCCSGNSSSSSSSSDADAAVAAALAAAVYKQQKTLKTRSHKLNALYFAHDIVQNEAVTKQSSPLLTAFKPWLPWMAREVFQACSGKPEEEQKVDRVLSLWVERGVLDQDGRREIAFLCRVPQQRLQQALSPKHDAERRTGGFSDHPLAGIEAPRGFDRRPEELGLTPETVSVGVMATMLRSIIKRTRHMHAAFVPYRPLDPLATPQTTPPLEPPSDYLLDRLQDFYEDLDHIEENYRRKQEKEGRRGSLSPSPGRGRSLSSESRYSRYSRSRSSSASLERKLEAREKERRLDASEIPHKPAKSTNWVTAEMGLADDGSFAGPRGNARLGLGASAEPDKPQQTIDLSNPFERFRHQRAGKYHEVMAAQCLRCEASWARAKLSEKSCPGCRRETATFAGSWDTWLVTARASRGLEDFFQRHSAATAAAATAAEAAPLSVSNPETFGETLNLDKS
ncbi:hypothetical protein Esti_003214 [Eimeria stiedai]